MPEWLHLLHVSRDEMGAWDLEVDRDAWRALLVDVVETIESDDEDDDEGEYGYDREDHAAYEREQAEERARRAELALAIGRAFPPKGPWQEWAGLYGRVRPERKAIVHRLRRPQDESWDPMERGTMTLCGFVVHQKRFTEADAPNCANCEGRLTWMRGRAGAG